MSKITIANLMKKRGMSYTEAARELRHPTPPIRLILTIDIEYNPNGVPERELRDLLSFAANNLSNNGFLTGETEATVESWDYRIERVGKQKI